MGLVFDSERDSLIRASIARIVGELTTKILWDPKISELIWYTEIADVEHKITVRRQSLGDMHYQLQIDVRPKELEYART